jgi:hypothetical protein
VNGFDVWCQGESEEIIKEAKTSPVTYRHGIEKEAVSTTVSTRMTAKSGVLAWEVFTGLDSLLPPFETISKYFKAYTGESEGMQ